VDSWLTARVAPHPAPHRGCALAPCGGLTRTPRGGRTTLVTAQSTRRRGTKPATISGAPCCPDGPERPIPRPHDAMAQKTCSSGQTQRPLLKHLLLIKSALRLRCLSETPPGSVHDTRLAATRAYPLPPGSQLRQASGFQAFTLDGVAILPPMKKPRGHELTRAQKARNRQLARRRVRIEPVNRRVKRWRRLQETIRMWQAGIRDMVRASGCARHNLRVRLTPSWTPMV
jgi:DDE superfamily endonuclease